MQKKIINNPLLLFAISIYCLLMLPRMLSYGMFFDGVTYASISRNLAEGFGSLWKPYYTQTIYPVFYEHPPMGFWLQSIAFRIFGNSPYIEAFWGFFLGLVVMILIALIWRKNILPEKNGNEWFPLFLFAIIPMFTWLFSSNMLEITMTVFVLLAALTCIIALKEVNYKSSIFYSIVSGLFILCAVLTKGPVGSFIFAVPLMAFFSYKEIKIRGVILISLIMVITFISILLTILYSFSGARELWDYYINNQLFASVSGSREKAGSHFSIVQVIFREMVVPFFIALILYLTYSFNQKKFLKLELNKNFIFYLLIALCGSLPILISPKQMGWYVFPSFPFYTLAIASLFNEYSIRLQSSVNSKPHVSKRIFILALLIFIISIILMFSEKDVLRKNKEFHQDFSIQHLDFKERETISVYPAELKVDWSLAANMQRFYKASLSDSIGYKYLLTIKDYKSGLIDSLYKKYYPENPKKYIVLIKK